MYDGTFKVITDVNVGDTLIGYSQDSMIDESDGTWMSWKTDTLEGDIVPVTVVQADIDYYKEYYVINKRIKITKSHPFFAKAKDSDVWGWIDSADLKVGDLLFKPDGSTEEVTSHEFKQRKLDVVTLNVENVDNYFAGLNPVLVHNTLVK